jgi:hypothetical protein
MPKEEKNLPAPTKKSEISLKKSSAAEKLKNVPDDVIVRVIRDTLRKQHEGNI